MSESIALVPTDKRNNGEVVLTLEKNGIRMQKSFQIKNGKIRYPIWLRNRIVEVSISEGIESIGDELKGNGIIFAHDFSNAENLTTINFPESLKRIGNNTFAGCSSLDNINFPSKLEEIGRNAFEGCRKIQSIDMPDTVTDVGCDAFKDCENLRRAHLSSELEAIPSGLFHCCSKLEEVEFPQKCKRICSCAFMGCGKLKEIKLPEKLAEIWERAFSGCSHLATVHIGENLRRIYHEGTIFDAFNECNSIRTVYLPIERKEYFKQCFPRFTQFKDTSECQGNSSKKTKVQVRKVSQTIKTNENLTEVEEQGTER